MIIAPAPGDKGGARFLHVEVPRRFSIAVEAADSDVAILSTGGKIDLHGKGVRATIQGNGGSLSAELEGGSLAVGASSEAVLKLRGTPAVIADMTGNVTVRAVGGTLSVSRVDGSTDIESDDCTLVTEALSGMLHLKARKGEATATGNKGTAEFELTGTSLHLNEANRDVTVTTDANVDFRMMNAALRVDMSGGTLRGKGSKFGIELHGRSAELNVEAIENGVHIQGDGIKAKVVDIAGELTFDTTLSDLVADKVGSVVAKVERGSVSVQRASGAVQATVVGGDVKLVDVAASVTIDLEGGNAEVSWASLSGDKDSQIVNKSGTVTATFPVSGSCRVDAKSTSGRVDSTLAKVTVSDDLSSATGPVNGGSRPVVHITANGDVHLLGAPGANTQE